MDNHNEVRTMKVTQTVFWERRHIVSKLTTTANIVSIRLLPSEKKVNFGSGTFSS